MSKGSEKSSKNAFWTAIKTSYRTFSLNYLQVSEMKSLQNAKKFHILRN